jgi:glutathione S-transferase
VDDEIRRICDVWSSCRDAFGADGPFLFGEFGIADAFFAPVVSRFRTYAVETDPACEAYAEAVWRHPLVEKWRADAESESWVEPEFDL